MGIRISKDHLHPSVIESISSLIGDLNMLETDAKGNAVEAINELLAGGGSKEEIEALIAEMADGKKLIANAVGEPLNAEDSFHDMSNDINGLLSTFKTNMMNNGIAIEANDKFKQLIDKITALKDSEGKGIQFVEGTIDSAASITRVFHCADTGTMTRNYVVIPKMEFEPTFLILFIYGQVGDTWVSILSYDETYEMNTVKVGVFNGGIESSASTYHIKADENVIVGDTIYLPIWGNNANLTFKYYAVGVGEEDTTLRDSLASILGDKGVDVTEEDDMASLISKVDERITDIDIENITCGYCTSFLIKKDNSLWGCGLGSNIGTTNNMSTFTHLMDDVKQVAANGTNGDQHVMVLKNDGSLWACGDNSKGQLGLNNTTDQKTFTQVTTNINNDVKQIACGSFYTMILKNDGTLWATGRNNEGQLGLNNTTDQKTFTQVTTNINNDVKQIACALNNTWVLKTDGTLWACGDNSNGQFGLGDKTDRTIFTQIIDNVKQIYSGVSNSIFIVKNDGTLWACGWNYYGQLGIGITSSSPEYIPFTQVNIDANDIKCVSCGHTVTVIIKNDGTLWGCGYASDGELGSLFPTSNSTFVKISNKSNNYKVCCGLDHTIVLKNDNSIWGAGNNYYGQLGIGSTSSSGVRTFNCVTGPF